MAGKRENPEGIALKFRQVEALHRQGKSVQEAVRQISVAVQTFYRWRTLYGGMGHSQPVRCLPRSFIGYESRT
jgi:putative transposase